MRPINTPVRNHRPDRSLIHFPFAPKRQRIAQPAFQRTARDIPHFTIQPLRTRRNSWRIVRTIGKHTDPMLSGRPASTPRVEAISQIRVTSPDATLTGPTTSETERAASAAPASRTSMKSRSTMPDEHGAVCPKASERQMDETNRSGCSTDRRDERVLPMQTTNSSQQQSATECAGIILCCVIEGMGSSLSAELVAIAASWPIVSKHVPAAQIRQVPRATIAAASSRLTAAQFRLAGSVQ